MTKETKTNNQIPDYTLSNGKKVLVDLSKNTGNLLLKCRQASNFVGTAIYMMSELATFDGEKIKAPDLLNLSAFEVMEIEAIWEDLKGKK